MIKKPKFSLLTICFPNSPKWQSINHKLHEVKEIIHMIINSKKEKKKY